MKSVAASLSIFLVFSAAAFAQSGPVPQISLPLVPSSTVPGGQGFTLTVNGAGFVSGAVVTWNGSPRTTHFISKTKLSAIISAANVVTAKTASVTVNNPGTPSSNVAYFSIINPVTTVAFTGSDFPTFGNPEYVTPGDFNGDGNIDLAVANWAGTETNQFAILLGNGDGTFRPVSLFPTGEGVADVTVGDFNGDGKLDVATVNSYSNTFSVLLGNGDGTFRSPITYNTGDYTNSIVTGDFNQDGKLDIAVGAYAGKGFIFLGNGDGTFRSGSTFSMGAFAMATGDFNGDGILDLATVNYAFTSTVAVALGNGDGTFQDAVSYASGPEPSSVVAADVNGDGILDLVTGDNDGASVLLGRGDGSFGTPTIYVTESAFADAATVADFNGDGIPDIAVGNETADTISVLLGNGDGTFQQSSTVFQGGASAFSITAADFNNDGAMDIALTAYNTARATGGVYASLQTNGPAVLFSQAGVSFPTQLTGTSSTMPITITNVGKESLEIKQIGMTGAQGRDFSQTNNCGTSLGIASSCGVSVTFTPRKKGARAAVLVIQDNAINREQSIPLSGTGTWMNLSPSSLDFGNQKVGTDSKMKIVTLTNVGSGPVTISQIGLENANQPQFTFQSSGCGTLAAGASCTIGIQFTPVRTGAQTNILGVQDNGGGVLQQTTLSGTGVN